MPKSKKKVRDAVPPGHSEAIAQALASVLGSDAVNKASDIGEPDVFIPSGVPELDLVLDRKGRGWPAGRIVEIYGASATAKTGIGYALIAEAQRLGGAAIIYPTEGNWDEWLARQYGIDFDRLIIGDDETVEGVFASLQAVLPKLGKDGILVAMIDSVAGLSTKEELEGEELRRDRGAQVRAMLISKALRKLGSRIPRTNALLFCVNQTRDAVDVQYGEKSKPPGGKAIAFYASVRLKLENLGKVTRQKAGKKYVAGYKIRITAVKNRMARPHQQAELFLDFSKGLQPIKGK